MSSVEVLKELKELRDKLLDLLGSDAENMVESTVANIVCGNAHVDPETVGYWKGRVEALTTAVNLVEEKLRKELSPKW